MIAMMLITSCVSVAEEFTFRRSSYCSSKQITEQKKYVDDHPEIYRNVKIYKSGPYEPKDFVITWDEVVVLD